MECDFTKFWDFSDAKIDRIWGLSWSLLEQVDEILDLHYRGSIVSLDESVCYFFFVKLITKSFFHFLLMYDIA